MRYFRFTYTVQNQDVALHDIEASTIAPYATRRELKGDLIWNYDRSDPVKGLTPRTLASAAAKAWRHGISETPFGEDGVLIVDEVSRAVWRSRL